MSPEDTRNILMLAAVEETDEGGILLSLKDRHDASREAGAPLPSHPGTTAEDRFLAARAAILLGKLRDRSSSAADWLDPGAPAHPSRHPGLVVALLLVTRLALVSSRPISAKNYDEFWPTFMMSA